MLLVYFEMEGTEMRQDAKTTAIAIAFRALVIAAAMSLGFATSGWAGDDAAAEKAEASVDAAPPADQADADAEKATSTDAAEAAAAEKKDDQAAAE